MGPCINEFGNCLPKSIDILRRYYNYGRSLSEAKKISELLRAIRIIYENNGVAIINTEHIRIKLKTLIKQSKAIVSTRKLPTDGQKVKEIKFLRQINNLFEISAIEPTSNGSSGNPSTTSAHSTEILSKVNSIDTIESAQNEIVEI